MSILSFFGYIYSEEIKAFLSTLSIPPIWFDPVLALFVVLMIVGSLAFAMNEASRLLRKKRTPKITQEPQTDKLAAIRVYKREELSRLGELFQQATQEIDFVGVGLDNVALHMDAIGERLEHGVTIRVIAPDPANEELMKRIEATYSTTNVSGIIRRTIDLLLRKRVDLPSVDSGKLAILTYNTMFPTYGMILLDPNTDNAKIQIEVYLAGINPDSRPVLIVDKKNQSELFETYYKSYRYILKHSV